MPRSNDPDCPWCSAAHTLEATWSEMGTQYYTCSCCGKASWLDERTPIAQRVTERDVNGVVIDGP